MRVILKAIYNAELVLGFILILVFLSTVIV